MRPHVGAVEEVPDGEQRGQDPPERLIGGQLLHAQLQVKQRLCDLLQGATESQSTSWFYGSSAGQLLQSGLSQCVCVCVCVCVCYLLQGLVVEFEGPELQAGGQGTDGGQAEQELLRRAQRNVRIGQLSLLDLLLLLVSGGHGQDLLLSTKGGQLSPGQIYSNYICTGLLKGALCSFSEEIQAEDLNIYYINEVITFPISG